MEAASSSSIWMKVPPTVGMRAAKRSTTSVEGVMGYPAANRAPGGEGSFTAGVVAVEKMDPVRTPVDQRALVASIRSLSAAGGR